MEEFLITTLFRGSRFPRAYAAFDPRAERGRRQSERRTEDPPLFRRALANARGKQHEKSFLRGGRFQN